MGAELIDKTLCNIGSFNGYRPSGTFLTARLRKVFTTAATRLLILIIDLGNRLNEAKNWC